MKKLKKSELLEKGQVEHVKAERNFLVEVVSDYIMKLYCSFQDAKYLYQVMEYLHGGDIMTLVMKEDTLTETVARFYIAQTVLAIESTYKHNYIYRTSICYYASVDRLASIIELELGLTALSNIVASNSTRI